MNLPAHGIALAANRKVPLGKTVRVGDIEVTPVRVWRLLKGDLQMEFVTKNLSNAPMTPIEDGFLRLRQREAFVPTRSSTATCERPATTTDGGYGGYLEYFDNDPSATESRRRGAARRRGAHPDHDRPEPKNRDYVNRIKGGNYLWRLQVRRGNVWYHGGEIPVTAVVGVQFTDNDIVAK